MGVEALRVSGLADLLLRRRVEDVPLTVRVGTGSPDDAGKLATRLADALQAPFELHTSDNGQDPPTVSMRANIDVAVASRNQKPAELLRQADLAMYASKRQGNGHVQVFNEDLGSENQRRDAVETALRAALAAG